VAPRRGRIPFSDSAWLALGAADLNDEDDEGLGWSRLSEARDPGRVRSGVMLVAGNRQAQAVVRVVAVDDDGQVHFTVLPGSVDKNRHLIGRALA
jgi:hypothetical protein